MRIEDVCLWINGLSFPFGAILLYGYQEKVLFHSNKINSIIFLIFDIAFAFISFSHLIMNLRNSMNRFFFFRIFYF